MKFDKRALYAVIGIVVLILLLVVAGLFMNKKPQTVQRNITFKVWSPLERKSVLEPLWTEYIAAYGMSVQYQQFSESEYESKLIDALASGKGPDIFFIKNTWLGRYFNKITSILDPKFYSMLQLENDFPDIVRTQAALGDKIWGLPLSIDTLALVYNRDYFNSAGIVNAPKTWDEFLKTSQKLTVKNSKKQITRAGSAMGLESNVENFQDIAAILMLQNGAQITDPKETMSLLRRYSEQAKPALDYYASFASSTTPVWNNLFENSLVSFAQGKLAMAIVYSSQLEQIRNQAPQLRWAVAPLPQQSGADSPKNYGEFWLMVVSQQTEYPNEAWQFVLNSARSPKVQDYLAQANRPPALKNLIPEFQPDPVLGVFATQNLTAVSWYQGDNKSVQKTFSDMIKSIVYDKTDVFKAIREASDQLDLILRQYPGSKAWEK